MGPSLGGKPFDKSSPCSRVAGAEREWPLSTTKDSAQALPSLLLWQVDSKENYLYPLRHLGFFLPFPKKRQDESGLEKISFTVLFITIHTQKKLCQQTEGNSILNRRRDSRFQRPGVKVKPKVYQLKIKHDKKCETIRKLYYQSGQQTAISLFLSSMRAEEVLHLLQQQDSLELFRGE